MRIKLGKITVIVLLLVVGKHRCAAQGTVLFQNLNFENPVTPLSQGDVPIANALPGWTGYIGGNQVNSVVFNTLSLGAAEITLQGPGSLEPIFQGNYTVLLQPSFPDNLVSAAIGQTGRIPVGAQSLTFDATGSFQVTFNGQNIPFTQIGTGPNYNIVGGDISMFAGQTGELRFTTSSASWFGIDDIRFSPVPVPEPSTFGLFALGSSLFALRLVRRR